MKHGKHATKQRRRLVRKPYAMLGAGPLAASIWKAKRKGRQFAYRFNIFRMCAKSGQVSQRFTPRDIPHLVSLVRLLAFEIANDGCLDVSLRDDLFCLAACLDEVLGKPRTANSNCSDDNPSAPLPRSVNWAIERVLDHLWREEADNFKETPCIEHIYRSLVVIHRWLDGSWSSDEVLVSFEDLEPSDHFGVCPVCGKNDGYLNVRGANWFVCHKHQVRWCVGDVFSTWKDESVDIWRRNWKQIGGYLEVEPFRLTDRENASEK